MNHLLRAPMLALLAAALWLPCAATARDTGSSTSNDDRSSRVERFIGSLHPASGSVDIPAAGARLNLSSGYSFLPAGDAQRVLTTLWHNPPDSDVLGMILPSADPHVLLDDRAWAVVVTYVDDGYVSDADAAGIDYDDMLRTMRKATHEHNTERLKRGYPAVELVGWAEPPHYDSASHKLFWARDLTFSKADGSKLGQSLNYDIRVLGRKGYLSLNAVAPIDQLDRVRADMPRVLAMAEFEPGKRYSDYDSHTDKLAAYGIGALVAGGIAAKAGLFAKLGIMLLALKKFIIVGLAAIAGLFKKLFRRKQA